jgi:nucleoside diphosphate kinase
MYLSDKQQFMDNLTYEENMSMSKYDHAKKFNIDQKDLTVDILKVIYKRTKVIDNYNDLMTYAGDINYEFDCIVKCTKLKKILDIINVLGFKINNGKICDIKINKDELHDKKNSIVELLDYNTRILFKLAKKVDSRFDIGLNDNNNKKLMGTVNKILDDYGLKIIARQTRKNNIKTCYNKLEINKVIGTVK